MVVILLHSFKVVKFVSPTHVPAIKKIFLMLVFLNATIYSTHHYTLFVTRLTGLFPALYQHTINSPKLSAGPAMADKCMVPDTMTGNQLDAQKKKYIQDQARIAKHGICTLVVLKIVMQKDIKYRLLSV